MAGLNLAEPVAVTLVRRGFHSVAAAREFLDAADDHDPFLFEGMDAVVAQIREATKTGKRVTVHGDYDVDGVCSTAIAICALRELGADCDWLIPGRQEDGYGLTAATLERLVARGTQLLITVDCGITSVAEVAAARELGIDVIVTDHHQPGAELPVCPILHPALSGYPFGELCATAVAYKLASALLGAERAARELDLVALATVTDLVPLQGENRALVRRGLEEARRARRPGLRALMATSKIAPERLDEGDFAFRLGPRINAAGRLYRADAGVELMLTEDPARAAEIATELDRANYERREVEREVLAEAETARRELPAELADAAGLVLAGEGWHPGVVGIVASRMVERHRRPVVLIALDAEGSGRGSGRSVPGFDLLAGLTACEEHLSRYGGHRAAAGLEIDAERVDDFRYAFAAHAASTLADVEPAAVEVVDAVVGGESLGHDVAEQLTRLAPFGKGNPGVRLLVAGANVGDVRAMGEEGRHARFSLASGSRRATGVAFQVNGELEAAARSGPLDVSVELELNEWNGAIEPRVVLGSLYLRDGDPQPQPGGGSPGDAQAGEGAIGDDEFWRRHDAELEADLSPWPSPPPQRGVTRELIDRSGASGVSTIAALGSSGETVLAICSDAVRRRELVERAARPGRFGGGEFAVVSARLADDWNSRAEQRVANAGAGVVLADWDALARDLEMVGRFVHIVVIDPAPFARLDALVQTGPGYLHLVSGRPETEFALRVHADMWPSRASLAGLYRALGSPEVVHEATAARRLLSGSERAHPHSPEVAARMTRVLNELALVCRTGSGAIQTLRAVSSEGTDLGRSAAYTAYRDRYEDGKRWLSEQRQN